MKEATVRDVRRTMRPLADPARAIVSRGYFKTGPGEYGEGDVFQGLSVPALRKLAKRFEALPETGLEILLASKIHEERLLAVLILVRRSERSRDPAERARLHRFYVAHLDGVDNWDIVDASAGALVGPYLAESPGLVARLSRSRDVWRRRVAIIAHSYEIRRGSAAGFLRLAPRFFSDEHDLIHKAVGWMLREVGQRSDAGTLARFLERNAARMPRTMLRYAIEKFPAKERRRLLAIDRAPPRKSRATRKNPDARRAGIG